MGRALGARNPDTVVVVGAGVLGLSTAWFLQEYGIAVTVVDRARPGAGASWGNAGWLSPGLALPINEPRMLRYGLRALVDPRAPLSIPDPAAPGLARFLTGFAWHSRPSGWRRAQQGTLPLNRHCLDAYDVLVESGVDVGATAAPITALFSSEGAAAHLLAELDHSERAGLPIEFARLSRAQAHAAVPHAADRVQAGVRIEGQRYLDPRTFTEALASSVRARGGTLVEDFHVAALRRDGSELTVRSTRGGSVSAGAVVAATGAWMHDQARSWGIRVPMAAGRGYSFLAATPDPVAAPVYLPEARIACTPHPSGLRIAGVMELHSPGAPMNGARPRAIAESARGYLRIAGLEDRADEWVGPRPLTADGLPLVGRTRIPGLYTAGGHGMWGLTQGPVTGRLLAEAIATGKPPAELAPLDPLR